MQLQTWIYALSANVQRGNGNCLNTLLWLHCMESSSASGGKLVGKISDFTRSWFEKDWWGSFVANYFGEMSCRGWTHLHSGGERLMALGLFHRPEAWEICVQLMPSLSIIHHLALVPLSHKTSLTTDNKFSRAELCKDLVHFVAIKLLNTKCRQWQIIPKSFSG